MLASEKEQLVHVAGHRKLDTYHSGGAVRHGDGGLGADPEVGVVDVCPELLQQGQRRHGGGHGAHRLLGLLAHEPLVLRRLEQQLQQQLVERVGGGRGDEVAEAGQPLCLSNGNQNASIFAMEFDTLYNAQFSDTKNKYVGVDGDSLVSLNSANIGN